MTLSKTCQYAIRALVFIAAKSSDDSKKLSISEISESINSPQPFTSKILQVLTKRKALGSSKGPGGGFYSNSKTEETSIFEVIEMYEGPDYGNTCLLGLEQCSSINPCPAHAHYQSIREETNKLLKNITIRQLATELAEGKDRLRIA